jgi:hypothetical protein
LGYILSWFNDVGEAQFTDSGLKPLSWAEIKAWQDLSGTSLDYWEAQLLRNMSLSYIAQYNSSQAEVCAPPWDSRQNRFDTIDDGDN